MHGNNNFLIIGSADKKEYPRNSILPEDYLDFDVNEYYQKYCEVLEKERHQGKQEFVGINSQACIKALPERLKEIMFHETQSRYLKSRLLKRKVFQNLRTADLLKTSEPHQQRDTENIDHQTERATRSTTGQSEQQQQSHRRHDGERSARATASLVDADRETQELIERYRKKLLIVLIFSKDCCKKTAIMIQKVEKKG